MGKKTGSSKKTKRKFWGFLGALWLVTACLAGCMAYGNRTAAGESKTVQVSGGVEDDMDQEKPDEEGTDLSEQSDTEPESVQNTDDGTGGGAAGTIEESGVYTSKDQVALYLHMYGRLPDNYITKREAEDLGWNSKEGNLWEVAPGMSIGGSRFGNYEGVLPDKKGRKYFECDIDYEGGYRGSKRLVYSDDGLIFYTDDHYNTFEQLYGQ